MKFRGHDFSHYLFVYFLAKDLSCAFCVVAVTSEEEEEKEEEEEEKKKKEEENNNNTSIWIDTVVK